VCARCVGTTTACPTLDAPDALNGTNLSLRADADVGSIAHEAVSAIGDVGSHGSETDDTAEGESSQTSHAKVISVGGVKDLFEGTGKLVATKRSGYESVFRCESLGCQCGRNLGNKLLVWECLWEELLDRVLRREVKNENTNLDESCVHIIVGEEGKDLRE
jgi:hypothetical protein